MKTYIGWAKCSRCGGGDSPCPVCSPIPEPEEPMTTTNVNLTDEQLLLLDGQGDCLLQDQVEEAKMRLDPNHGIKTQLLDLAAIAEDYLRIYANAEKKPGWCDRVDHGRARLTNAIAKAKRLCDVTKKTHP